MVEQHSESRDIESLVSPLGVVGWHGRSPVPRGLSRVNLHSAGLGSGRPGRPATAGADSGGAGRALDSPDLARTVAIAEAAERYAGINFQDEHVWAKVAELDGNVLDVSRIPRCSYQEYANPDCPLVPFDPKSSIRWVNGLELGTATEARVPAVMACYGLDAFPKERFWHQISTGFAVHADPREALVGAISEVIERDSIALLWQQRLPLPPVARCALTENCEYFFTWSERHFVETYLFDATTDLKVPVVFCLQVAEYDQRAQYIAGCSAGSTIGTAAEKALLEATTIRVLFDSEEPAPNDFRNFSSVMDGARYMARHECAPAFRFLLDGSSQRRPTERQRRVPGDPAGALDHVIETLRQRGMPVFAIDRTTRELADVGLTAVSVVIPDLQPMSLQPLAQYRAHQRLYAAPERMGYRSSREEDLNPWPIPFG